MSLKTFNVDVAIAEALYQPETRENRMTRSQLRLSSNWKGLGRTIGSSPPELSDEYPDLPLVPEDGETYEGGRRLVRYALAAYPGRARGTGERKWECKI